MSPSELSWLQGCLFLFLGVAGGGGAGGYSLNRCQNRRTNRGTSDVELSSIRLENEIATTSFDDAQSSGSDEEVRSPSNLSNRVGEAMVFTGSLSWPDCNRLRSKSVRRRPRRFLKPSAKTRKTSHFLEFVAKTGAPIFATRETASSTIDADRTPTPMSSTTAGLPRRLGGEDEALSPSHPVAEALTLPGTPSCPDRKRCRSVSYRRMNAPEKKTKSHFEKFMAKDEARNVGKPEPTNMIVADSFSTSMASTTAVLRRPPRRHFIPRPSREIPLVHDGQANTFGLRRRPRISQAPSMMAMLPRHFGVRFRPNLQKWTAEIRVFEGKFTDKKMFGVRFRPNLQKWTAEIRVFEGKFTDKKMFGVRFRPNLQKWTAEIRVFEGKFTDKKMWLGTFDTEVGAACTVDAARKLLKCRNKSPPNFPCAALSAYTESIPSHLQLTNITEDRMFKEVSLFVKRKAKEYAAGFCTGKGTTAVGLRE